MMFWFCACFCWLLKIGESFIPHQHPRFLIRSKIHRPGSRIISTNLVNDEFDDDGLSRSEVESLTIPQLKQQLRLRGLKVSGKKQELVKRLLDFSGAQMKYDTDTSDNAIEPDILSKAESVAVDQKSKSQKLAEERGKEFIDVTAYLDEVDAGQSVKSSMPKANPAIEEDDNPVSSDPEVWGADARIVDDLEGNNPVVDGMSRTIVEYKGSNQTMVQAYVVASRDALKAFLAGGNQTTIPEQTLLEIQTKREQKAKRPVRFEDDEGLDEGDENGIFTNILNRDFSDWGKYTVTGAQLSAQEVQGVLLLSDVYGAYTDDTKILAEKIAFECQPVVVMVPDLFRGQPWKEDPTTPGFNEKGQDYEEWRAEHSDLRVSVDIRAAAAVIREQYGVSSVVVWGTCYGGGRALEVAAGYLPGGKIHDVNGAIGPAPVEPDVVVAWYPTRYNATELFGSSKASKSVVSGKTRKMAVMGVFAGNDQLAGATPDDASLLKSLLEEDERVKDYMIKVFPNQDHGFAHIGLSKDPEETEFERFVDNEFGGSGRVAMDDGDAEVACLLSTAFMETYSRMFLPTAGPPISQDDEASEWNDDLNMKDLSETTRDVRQEIEASLDNFVEEPLGGRRMDPTNDSQRDELREMLRGMEPDDVLPEYKIEDDDTIEIMYAKLKAYDDTFQIF
jgi:dienelactone hydrolase